MELLKLMLSRRWIVATLIVVSVMAIFVRLGIWQLDRLEQRRAQNAQLVAVLEGEPLNLPEDEPPTDIELLENRDVIVSGTYDFEHQKLLILQTWGGRNGANLITPLVLADGQTAVLIDRGWIPDAELNADNIATMYNQTTSATIQGYVALPQILSRQAANTESVRPENEIYRVDTNALGDSIPYELYDFYIVEPPAANDLEAFPYHKTRIIDLSEGPHLSYAIQWFLFALVLAVLHPIFVRRRSRATAN
ncbi:MAG: SURF1 family protein [Chloroflexota bacterium]